MSHRRYHSQLDAGKEPHSISLKVLRLSRPSLVSQSALAFPLALATGTDGRSGLPKTVEASLAYAARYDTNPDQFVLSPILNLPPSFGSAYVGQRFSCTLCANHEGAESSEGAASGGGLDSPKNLKNVRIEAEMKTPSSAHVISLETSQDHPRDDAAGADLKPGDTLQKLVNFDLKEEGNHVLAVTVSYYETTGTSGRMRTFRKLYQFICKASLIVRTKVGAAVVPPKGARRRWVMEAQLENCSEEAILLERVALDLEQGLEYVDCNWDMSGSPKPQLQPGEVEQVSFIVKENGAGIASAQEENGRVTLGVLGIGWRGEMGNRGYLTTGKLGSRLVK